MHIEKKYHRNKKNIFSQNYHNFFPQLSCELAKDSQVLMDST